MAAPPLRNLPEAVVAALKKRAVRINRWVELGITGGRGAG